MNLGRYLQFLSKSTNQHGVHSPFIYKLVTECFYDKKKYPEYKKIKTLNSKDHLSTKQEKLLFRLTRYFNFKNVLLLENDTPSILEILATANTTIQSFDSSDIHKETTILDFIYIDSCEYPYFEKQITILLTHTYNNSVLILRNIHTSKTSQHHWNYLKEHPKVSVTIDTYAFGFVFFRKEQAKEHFVIRL